MRAIGAAVAVLAMVACKSKDPGEQPAPEQTPAPQPAGDPEPPEADPPSFHCQGRSAVIDINRADPDFSDRVVLDCQGGPITVELYTKLDRKPAEVKAFEIDQQLFQEAWSRVTKSEWQKLGETCDGLPVGDLHVRIDVKDGAVRRKLRCNRVSSPILIELDGTAQWLAEQARARGEEVQVVDIPPPDDLPPGVDEDYAPPERVPRPAKPLGDIRGFKLTSESLGPLTLGMEVGAVAELGDLPAVELWAQKGLICAIVLTQAKVPTESGPAVGDGIGDFKEAYGGLQLRPDKKLVAGPYVLTVRKPRKLPRKLEGRKGKRAMKLAVAKIAVDQCEPPPAQR
ncbi:MAG: hypothetical protein KJO07_22490 [Deltaproteobacteria bacterium]|nr:hypothetical protein [Deltaproteobacteria bacterium]